MTGDLRTILAGYGRRLNHIHRESCRVISQKTHDRTPVDTGELRDSWVIDPQPDQLQLGDTFRMGTDSPYARYIEYLSPPPRRPGITRYDPVEPYGMMRRSIAEWGQIVQEANRGSRSA